MKIHNYRYLKYLKGIHIWVLSGSLKTHKNLQ